MINTTVLLSISRWTVRPLPFHRRIDSPEWMSRQSEESPSYFTICLKKGLGESS